MIVIFVLRMSSSRHRDHLLDPAGFDTLYKFLQFEISEESLEFWKEIEALHKIADVDHVAIASQAMAIYSRFLADDSPRVRYGSPIRYLFAFCH